MATGSVAELVLKIRQHRGQDFIIHRRRGVMIEIGVSHGRFIRPAEPARMEWGIDSCVELLLLPDGALLSDK
jgi:hypothetical protein